MTLESRITSLAQAIGTDIKALQATSSPGVPALSQLLVYYGYPIAYRGLWNVAAVVAEIAANFSVWVVGDAYGAPAHEEYASTLAIVAGVRAAGVQVYGYVPIGLNTSALTVGQMQTRVDQWHAVGVDGIFLDEFGFDYGNTRTRQNAIVDYVHGKGLPYCANAWTAEDFMCDNASELPWGVGDWRYINFVAGNPGNLVLARNANDCYLIENFCFSHTGPGSIFDVQERGELTAALAAAKNVKLWALAVLPETVPGNLNGALLGHLGSLGNVGAYVAANAYLYSIPLVGSGGFSFGSNGSPLWAPLPGMPAVAEAPTAAAAGNYGTFTATRQFGPVQIVVTNTASVQSVAVNDPTGSVLGGNYPGQGQMVIVSATAPANPVLNQLWVQT